ncbi:MAG TPA: NAD(P)-dependent oxidoreductase [Alphaproteobacteria bacterium]|nr:NAD(P)-dependent oxidoreductase [Alphaproteobacteria bacterium]
MGDPIGPIGFVGLGNMGRPMASRLVDAGHDLVVFDTAADRVAHFVERGATAATDLVDVANQVETVFMSLPVPEVVRTVAIGANGLVHGSKMKLCIDLSTTGSRVARIVGEGLNAAGRLMLDSPVSGGTAGAAAGTLAVMVSGPRAEYAKLKPVLDVIGNVFFVGEKQGLGQTMKLINNVLSATAMAMTSEALVLGAKAGLEPETMLDVVNAGSGQNTATTDKFPNRILPRKFDSGFSTGLMHKDVALFLEEAALFGVPTWVGHAVEQMWQFALMQDGPDADFTTIVKHAEGWAGAELKGRTAK